MPDDRQVERPLLCPNAPERSITIATKAVHLRIFIYLLFDMKNRGFTLYLAYPWGTALRKVESVPLIGRYTYRPFREDGELVIDTVEGDPPPFLPLQTEDPPRRSGDETLP